MVIKIPKLFDLHVHFRDPGQTEKETLETGSLAARKGGFGGVLCMPNTLPPADNADIIRYVTGERNGVEIYSSGTITKGLLGKELTDFSVLKNAGALAVTDDGKPICDMGLFMEALKKAEQENMILISHSEALEYSGEYPNADKRREWKAVEREINASMKTECPIHLTHISCKESLNIIRQARKSLIPVTCDTAPHYFTFSTDNIENLIKNNKSQEKIANYKMNPPLRSSEDVEAVAEAIDDGTVDCIITDHAPHTPEQKNSSYEYAPNGIIGLETSFSASVTQLYHKYGISIDKISSLMSSNPRKILKLPDETEYIAVDLDAKQTVNAKSFCSKSRNCPWDGMELYGCIIK